MAACDFIDSGRLLECKNFTGGLVNAYLAQFAPIGATVVNSELTGLGTLDEVFKFELKNTANTYIETETASRDNGTIFYDSQLSLMLTGLSSELLNQAKLLSRDRMLIFLEDNNGLFHAIGLKNGVDKTTGTRELGGALGDFYGLKLTLQALEPDTAPILSTSAVSSLMLLVSNQYVNGNTTPPSV
jgi:hypothetical protein